MLSEHTVSIRTGSLSRNWHMQYVSCVLYLFVVKKQERKNKIMKKGATR